MVIQKEFKKDIKNQNFKNVYLFCGTDENLIKEKIEKIKKQTIQEEYSEFNYVEYDGEKVTEDIILNACETMPFMSNKKVILIYRADFLKDKVSKDRGANRDKEIDEQPYKFLKEYINKVPDYCVLIMYYLFESNRDKSSYRIKKLEGKNSVVVHVNKLKGMELTNKVKAIFDKKNVKIGKSEVALFCNEVENNMNIIENEIDKLCAYTVGREITKEDIYKMLPYKSENDIFNLVECISQNNIKMSIDILNELCFRGEKITGILYMIEKQYKKLFDVKIRMEQGFSKEKISQDLKIHPYGCQITMAQCKNFSEEYLTRMINECLECEKRLKTSSSDSKIELEMLIVKGVALRAI